MQLGRRTFSREPYQEYRSRLQQRWRPHVLERDRNRCRHCGSREDLEMAHITDCSAFSRAAGRKEGVTFSFRWDNLVTLCALCHHASHAHRLSAEDVHRRLQVQRFLEGLRKLRGWHSPYAVLPPELVPERLRPHRSFHDVMRLTPLVPFPTFARYASDGGMVFRDAEAPPRQARLTPPEEASAPVPRKATASGASSPPA
jgi:5-methylcytosine-specific restriction endonuclease McrA